MNNSKTTLAGTALLLISAGSVQASDEQVYYYKSVNTNGTSRVIDPLTRVGTSSVSLNYDNYLPTFFGGSTVLRGSRQVGFDEVGDDLNLVGQIGRLDTMDFSISNRSMTNGFGVGQFTIRARSRTNGQLIGQTSFAFDLDMPVNTGAFFELPQGIFAQSNIILSSQIWLTFQWDYINFAESAAVVYTPFGSPQVVGSSSSMIRNFTTGADIDLGGGGLPNSFMWYVATSPVPSPGAMVVLATGAALAARRRGRG